jgi:DNA-binding transcriptional LysR family regulator
VEKIELSDLRRAIAVSQHRSLRQAAQTLNIRQSTLSRRLRDIEYCLGACLFERTNGGTRPTGIGLEFLEVARRILDQSDSAFRKLKSRSRGEHGRISIGVYASLATGNMQATLAEHHRRFPDVDLHTVDGTHDKLLCALVGNAVDVAVMTTAHSPWDDRILPLWSERVIAALPKRHPFGERSTVRWTDLRNERILLPLGKH